jgi:hypothetical protein
MRLQYELKHGSYYLYDMDAKPSVLSGEREIRIMTDTVALCFRRGDGSLLRHGGPDQVEPWAAAEAQRLRAAGLADWADEVTVVTGAFPVDELNRCLTTTGYCSTLMRNLAGNGARQGDTVRPRTSGGRSQ